MERPKYIDISTTSSRAASSAGTARSAHPSPKIQHYDGEIPPILSPLDAFAAESRRLAKELEATRIAGERRMSRLPPAVITQSLSQHQANRPACFRSLSGNSPNDQVPPLPSRNDIYGVGSNAEVWEPIQRPTSSYQRISAVEGDENGTQNEIFETPREHPLIQQPQDYFEIPRTSSPLSAPGHLVRPAWVNRSVSGNSLTQDVSGLVPPQAPFARKPYNESSDDDYSNSNAGSTFSQARKLSNSSSMSFPVSPALVGQHERTPSTKSDASGSSLNRSKQSYNYSRPLSQTSLNVRIESPTRPGRHLERKASHLSEETRNMTSFEDDRSVLSDGFISGTSSSYTHNKFVLPRGKMAEKASERVSQLFSGLSGPTFGWSDPVLPGTPPLSARPDGFFGPSSPGFRPSFDPGSRSLDPGQLSLEPQRPSTSHGKSSFEVMRPSTSHGRPTTSHGKPSPLAGQAAPTQTGFSFGFEEIARRASEQHDEIARRNSQQEERPSSPQSSPHLDTSAHGFVAKPFSPYNTSYQIPALPTIPGSTADDMSLRSSKPTTITERSASTIRPTTGRSHSDYQALSADEHVDKAIALHQHGDLKESTYHLRIAAKQNHPTGMLLYALACRHGWGMRANPREGVALLRKAVDIAMLEVADDEDASSPIPKANAMEQKSHRAQFALAIYELGISHLNGWGVEQDKALALRCFEIAGSWGDADALTEAGFCYAEGIGTKKDLRKAAKFYRMAADKGVSMVGNSWIYKDKYNDVNNDKHDQRSRTTRKESMAEEAKGAKKRNKSKTRSIFGRKRGNTVSEKDKEKTLSQPRVSAEQSVR